MPKSRKKRKKRQKESSRSAPKAPLKQKKKRSLREVLYRDNAAAFVRILSFVPVFVGAWIAGGLLFTNFISLSLVVGVVVCAHYFSLAMKDERKGVSVGILRSAMLVSELLLIGYFYQRSQNVEVTALLVLVGLLALARPHIKLENPFGILCFILALILQMSLLAVLGVYSQQDRLIYSALVLGIVPAFILSASITARQAKVLEARGWKRSVEKEIQTKKGPKQLVRPLGTARLFSLLLIVGPALVIALTLFQLLPQPFILTALILFSTPKIAASFLKDSSLDCEIADKLLMLTAFSHILMLVLGVISAA